MIPTIQSILPNDGKRLASALDLDTTNARIEVQCLLQAVLQVHRAYLFANPEQQLTVEQQVRYATLIERRCAGEPLAYILGEREFYGLNFKVTPATLIPRADTELLVDLALQRIPSSQSLTSENKVFRVLDLGAGSGAIALTIAKIRPHISVSAVDSSLAALAVTQDNMKRLQLSNVRLLQSNWFFALPNERFDLIVSNPPYIADSDEHLAQGDLRFEPHSALSSGADGLNDIRHIVAQSSRHLSSDGWLMLEHGYNQAPRVRELLQQAGLIKVFSAKDMAGIERVSGGKMPQ